MNPRRPHPFQSADSSFVVRADLGRWAVFESYQIITRQRQKDDIDRPVAWFDTMAEADAEAQILNRELHVLAYGTEA